MNENPKQYPGSAVAPPEGLEAAPAGAMTPPEEGAGAEDPARRQYRTRGQAHASGAVADLPDRLALPSRTPYENALTTIENPAAFLLQVFPQVLPELHFEGGTLYFHDSEASKVGLVQFRDSRMETVKKLDTPTLNALYTILLAETMKSVDSPESLIAMVDDKDFLDRSVTLYMPDFLRMLGHSGASRTVEDAVFAKVMSFEGILGGLEVRKRGRTYIDYFPLLQLRKNEQSEHSISFASPFMNRVITKALNDSIQKDLDGNPKPMRDGRPFLYPNHCYLVKSSIAKERNKRAVEIVLALAVLIDKTGDGLPHIKVGKLIERCPELKAALDEAAETKRKNTILRRAFSGAWALMKSHTIIEETYEDIRIPGFIPTASAMDKTIEIPHKGKKERLPA